MWKLGVTSIQQLQRRMSSGRLQGNPRISITIYEDVSNLINADVIAEQILFDFADDRRAFKRTYRNRFDQFDEDVLSILKKSSPIQTIHDVGVSDGRTALDFFEKTSRAFPGIDYLATDISGSLLIAEHGKLKVTMNKDYKPLEVAYTPFVFNIAVKDSRLRYPINHLAYLILDFLLVRKTIDKVVKGIITPTKLFLFSPAVLRKASETPRFRVAQHDILMPFPAMVDVVRAMNVLNPTYFTTVEFSTVLRNIYDALNPRGFLITGSNEDAGSTVQGAIYVKVPKGFERLRSWGDGSPVDALIREFRA